MAPDRLRPPLRRPPKDLDALVDWFEQVSYQLVLIAEDPLDDVRTAVESFASAVLVHCEAAARRPATGSDASEPARILRADHAWFVTSVDQLRWFFRVVEREDHGGNRQALGQYGRIFAEAFRRHRQDEARSSGTKDGPVAAAGRSPPRSAY